MGFGVETGGASCPGKPALDAERKREAGAGGRAGNMPEDCSLAGV